MTTCTDCGREISEQARTCPGCGAPGPAAAASTGVAPDAESQTRQWAMWLHLSMLAGFIVPFLGLIAPIVIWQVKKTDLPGLDPHGKNAVNWIISEIIYMVASLVLILVIIGIPLILTLLVLSVVFPILAGVKANNGEVWKYPLAIPFLR